MLSMTIPNMGPKTLYEASKITGGLDICDRDWDTGVYFECPESWEAAGNDAYDLFMLMLGCNIKVETFREDWYTSCLIAAFMWENRDVFDPFFNANNKAGYRPKDYENLDPEEDTGFFEAYMQPFESLLAGNYSDDDYRTLYDALKAKAKLQAEREDQRNAKKV